jgi:uncharacterized protein (DUF58 family)
MSTGITLTLDELIKLRIQGYQLGSPKAKLAKAPISGHYRSLFRGRGMDFNETRPYQPGDDIRHMDWRVTARTGKAHSKLFHEERERPVLLVIDYSPSLFFGSKKRLKSATATEAAALIAWSVEAAGDRVGALIFGNQTIELPPRRGQRGVLSLLNALNKHQPTAPSTQKHLPSEHMFSRLRRVSHPGDRIILISDFAHFPNEAENHLRALSHHHDILCLFIFDPLEADLPPPGHYTVTDGQQFHTFDTRDATLRQRYQQHFQQRIDQVQKLCHQHNLYFQTLATDSHILQTLQDSPLKAR